MDVSFYKTIVLKNLNLGPKYESNFVYIQKIRICAYMPGIRLDLVYSQYEQKINYFYSFLVR
jgi:hypothetical protein